MIDTGLPRDMVLSELSAEEAIELCEEFNAQADAVFSDSELQEVACFSAGVVAGFGSSSFDVGACEAAVEECLQTPGESESSDESNCDNAVADLASCNVTAGQVEDCFNALFEQATASLDLLSCESLSDPDALAMLEASQSDSELPSECEVVESDCPGIGLTNDSSDSGGGSSGPPSASGCDDTCSDASDGFCDDGGPGSDFGFCGLGTDCTDCGPRDPAG